MRNVALDSHHNRLVGDQLYVMVGNDWAHTLHVLYRVGTVRLIPALGPRSYCSNGAEAVLVFQTPTGTLQLRRR